jgi:hypothetical protein
MIAQWYIMNPTIANIILQLLHLEVVDTFHSNKIIPHCHHGGNRHACIEIQTSVYQPSLGVCTTCGTTSYLCTLIKHKLHDHLFANHKPLGCRFCFFNLWLMQDLILCYSSTLKKLPSNCFLFFFIQDLIQLLRTWLFKHDALIVR